MPRNKSLSTSFFVLLSVFFASSIIFADIPNECKLQGIPRTKQLENYCGPACMASVLNYYGVKITQQEIGKAVYDASVRGTNGADMLYLARKKGFAAYSWNTSIDDVKKKIAAGVPVIVLQQNSIIDDSGHFRVLTGYDDSKSKFSVMDPYYDDITELTYDKCKLLWKKMGFWALAIMPADKDCFKAELNEKNAVVHMDLAYATYKHKEYNAAMNEAKLALSIEPQNSYTISMINKIQKAMGAGAK